MTDLPIACTLSPDDLRNRRADLLTSLVARARSSTPLENGMEFRFDASSATLADLTRAIDAERQCCRFFHFNLTIAPDLGPITLTLTGPPGTGAFLAGLLEPPSA